MRGFTYVSAVLIVAVVTLAAAEEQQQVAPGINDAFIHPDVDDFVERFEVESREVFERRQRILDACKIKRGDTVADVGAGTGLFTRMFSKAVGDEGRVIAVDIASEFLDHIRDVSRQLGQKNVDVLLCDQQSTRLPPNSVDVAFICDTYHHFEHPQKTMASIRRSLKPDGRVILVDFRRIPGESSEWTLDHVRAGQEVFEKEIEAAGFRKSGELRDILQENYLVEFKQKK